MAFESRHQVVISSPVSRVYDLLSSADNFERFLHLSPTCHSVEILHTDQVVLGPAAELVELATRDLEDLASCRPQHQDFDSLQHAGLQQPCLRVHFKMVERISTAFGLIKIDVTIFGTQIMHSNARVHIYESNANKGLVKIYKLRRFSLVENDTTQIEELIVGKTNWLLRSYTQSACRTAHQKHMQSYKTLIS